jgi:hypothetical protein
MSIDVRFVSLPCLLALNFMWQHNRFAALSTFVLQDARLMH